MKKLLRFIAKYPEVLQAALKVAVCYAEFKAGLPKGSISNYDKVKKTAIHDKVN